MLGTMKERESAAVAWMGGPWVGATSNPKPGFRVEGSVLKLNIHWVDTCTPRRDCDTHHESTHVAWLRHMKPFESLIGGEACPDCVVAR